TYFDALTGLPNRILFKDRMENAFSAAKRHGQKVGVFFIDLDRFKYVNDTMGHGVGDRLLVHVAREIEACVRHMDTVSRLGGDEFTVILSEVSHEKGMARVAGNIIQRLQRPIRIDSHEIYIGASIGIGIHPDDGEDFETITRNADAAMYQTKESGRNTYRFYTAEMNARTARRLELERNLHQALAREEFVLNFQPKVDIASGRISGMETLVRWHPDGGDPISPGEFIPVAEETGLILPLGEWILRQACRTNRQFIDAGLGPFRMAVNLSPRQFQRKDLASMVAGILAETGLPPANLELEITESMVMTDVDKVIATLTELTNLGVHISMDDFGTGYSSLSYLRKLPIHSLKVDRSFVSELPANPEDAAIVTAIVALAHNLGLLVVAEGVETPGQLEFLRQLGCEEYQGFLFSRPLSTDNIRQLLTQETSAHHPEEIPL
ncbi:MAG: EAL domain-containing protein, partial [Magnetococcales bacterium]|nr:EAL domain-containing protein [Magnetococcales bacterium]